MNATQREIDSDLRPRASYVMPDGTPYVPTDYFELETDRQRFGKPPSRDTYIGAVRERYLRIPNAI